MTKRTFSPEKFRAQRELRGYSQRELADASGIHRQTIAAVEQGARKDPQIATLVDVADVLGCSVDDFLEPVRSKR